VDHWHQANILNRYSLYHVASAWGTSREPSLNTTRTKYIIGFFWNSQKYLPPKISCYTVLFHYNHSLLFKSLKIFTTWLPHPPILLKHPVLLLMYVQLLKHLLQWNEWFISLNLSDRFPMICFITKATPITIINLIAKCRNVQPVIQGPFTECLQGGYMAYHL